MTVEYEKEKKPEGGGVRLNLNSLEATRKSYCRILRMAARGQIEEGRFRALAYGFNGLLQYWHAETELDLEKRLQAIEEKLKGKI